MLPHKVWEGRNVFLCGGRIILGHAPKLLPLTLSLLLFTTVYETFFLVPKFSDLVAHANGPWSNIFVMWHHLFAGYLLLSLLVLFSSFATIVVEPGIIPRPSFLRQPLSGITDLAYCPRCQHHRHERARHCKACDNCVEDFDHHCVWLGVDIGKRNYKYFLVFIASLSVFTLVTLFVCGSGLYLEYIKLGMGSCRPSENCVLHAMSFFFVKNCLTSICFLLAVIFVIPIVSLCFYHHFYLLCIGETTNENLRRTYIDKSTGARLKNKYHKGYCGNLKYICCSSHKASNVPFKRLCRKIACEKKSQHDGIVGYSTMGYTGLSNAEDTESQNPLNGPFCGYNAMGYADLSKANTK